MTELLLCLLIASGLAIWWYFVSTREHALAASKQHCDQMGVQFLDGSVIANGYKFSRNRSDSLVIIQCFTFEFSTSGDERYNGFAELAGKRVIKMELEPHRL